MRAGDEALLAVALFRLDRRFHGEARALDDSIRGARIPCRNRPGRWWCEEKVLVSTISAPAWK